MQPLPRSSRMSPEELRAGVALGSLFALRMLGLFLILPVFAVHAVHLRGGDDLALVGIALGAYGLTQAVLQLPYGIAADRLGRKRVIVFGLLVFAAGSFLAAAAHDIWLTILGRSLQGAGAISAAVMALAADLSRDEHRTKIMAIIGGSIGLVFALSLVAAPWLYRAVGMAGIFALTGALALAGVWVVLKAVPPEPAQHVEHAPDLHAAVLGPVLRDAELLRLNFGIFALHMTQMAMFVVVPTLLVERGGLPLIEHWKVYLPVVLASFVLMVPPLLAAERRGRSRRLVLGAIALLAAAQLGLTWWATGLATIALWLLAFFVAFNLLEAAIPSLVTRVAPPRAKATALGVYNTTQAFGLFAGGALGGWLAKHFGGGAVFLAGAAVALAWAIVAAGMKVPPPVASCTVAVSTSLDPEELRRSLASVRGVREAVVVPGEGVAHLKVMPGWDESSVMKLVKGRTRWPL
ncbi:MAG TPA: MFS transporter [Burkholderiales bacterium]|nr:MFS transporter [Burkholderiales bacterium]